MLIHHYGAAFSAKSECYRKKLSKAADTEEQNYLTTPECTQVWEELYCFIQSFSAVMIALLLCTELQCYRCGSTASRALVL